MLGFIILAICRFCCLLGQYRAWRQKARAQRRHQIWVGLQRLATHLPGVLGHLLVDPLALQSIDEFLTRVLECLLRAGFAFDELEYVKTVLGFDDRRNFTRLFQVRGRLCERRHGLARSGIFDQAVVVFLAGVVGIFFDQRTELIRMRFCSSLHLADACLGVGLAAVFG